MDSPNNAISNEMNTPEDITLHSFLYKLTNKTTIRCNQHRRVQLLEDDAFLLCHLLIKEGYFDINDVNGCTICAIQNLEKKIMRQMKQQIEIVKKARYFYSQPENAKFYKLCSKHRSGNQNCHANHSQPQRQSSPHPKHHHVQPQFVQPQQIIVSFEPPKYFIPYPMPPPHIAYVPEPLAYFPSLMNTVIPQVNYDSFIPIPWGVDPMCFMINYNEWVKHLQQFYGSTHHKRMPYTNNIPLEITEDTKTVGRRFV